MSMGTLDDNAMGRRSSGKIKEHTPLPATLCLMGTLLPSGISTTHIHI